MVDLWRQHIFGGSGPQDFSAKFGPDFVKSPTTKVITSRLTEALKAELEANPPAFPPGVDTITIDLASRIAGPMSRLETPGRLLMDFNIVNEIPGNIAGGIGKTQISQQVGAMPAPFDDSRAAKGTATITRNPDGSLTAVVNVHYTVQDTIDLCPGNCGADMEMIATRPLSWLEASGVSGDVPFTVDYDAPPEIITTSAPPPTPLLTEGEVTASSLRIRQSPNTSAPIVGRYARGTKIQIECQVPGPMVNGNSQWNKTDRGYVSDAYVRHSSPPPAC
ncbi:MAG TPA: hypothetical protein VER79_03465 [Candidatus Limnocylindrales bacterium]|nr:hypothetical protein [Candidatus Limnocylindrales bacterium]